MMLEITSKVKNYAMEMVDDIFVNRDAVLAKIKSGRRFYFVDQQVWQLYEQQLRQMIGDDFYLLIEARETNKEYVALVKYYKVLIDQGFQRNDILITLGGGILQDLSGFVASTLYRGIPWVFIPTTLLAQADSCIGSKTSINFGGSKNLIGSFYPPDQIFIDTQFCKTLTPEYFNSGLGEIIKFHLMSDQAGYNRLKEYLSRSDLRDQTASKQIIWSTLRIKKSYFDADEFDTGRRNLLNYGHCFGHALEAASNFEVAHGEAVIVGMGFANLLSLQRGILKKESYDEFEKIFQKYYPRFDLAMITVDLIIQYLKCDKKRVGRDLTMILCKGVGDQEKYDDLKEAEICETYNEFLKIYPKYDK